MYVLLLSIDFIYIYIYWTRPKAIYISKKRDITPTDSSRVVENTKMGVFHFCRFVEKMIQKGYAVLVLTNHGTYVCTNIPYPLKLPPIHYPCLRGHIGDSYYPIWAPFVDGTQSTMGTGHPTVNLHVIIRSLGFETLSY